MNIYTMKGQEEKNKIKWLHARIVYLKAAQDNGEFQDAINHYEQQLKEITLSLK